MVDLGCQDMDWVGRHDKDILDAILLRDGFILATLRVDNGIVVILGAFLISLGP